MAGWLVHSRQEAQARLAEQLAATERERAENAVLEERARIARELHDVVAHHMSVISIQADAGPYRVSDPPPELTEAFATIRATALTGLGELRRLLGVPGPSPRPRPRPSLADLDRLVEDAEASGDLGSLPPGVSLNAYRIIQEALTNTMRHAPGATVHVRVALDGGELRIDVTNTAPRRSAGSPRPAPGTASWACRNAPPCWAAPSPPDPPATAATPSTPCCPPRRRRDAIRVLIADDQAMSGRASPILLGVQPGIEVVGTAVDGADALAKAAELDPDVIVMDVRMLEMNGIEAPREITRTLPGPRAHPHHVRPGRIRLRGAPRRGQRLPAEGRLRRSARRGDQSGRRR